LEDVRPLVVLLIVGGVVAGCALRQAGPPPSPHCRAGSPLVGVYHPERLKVKGRCRVAVGSVEKVKPELYDGDSVPLEAGIFAGLAIDVRHLPGHTPGSVVLGLGTAEGGRLALTGDTLFAGSVGRGADPAAVRTLLESLPDDTVVLPGHGPATTIGRERAGNPFLVGTGA